jgi:hypothetical protein
LRKDADLEIENRIRIAYTTDDAEVLKAVQEWNEYIRTETLADDLTRAPTPHSNAKPALVGEAETHIAIERVGK